MLRSNIQRSFRLRCFNTSSMTQASNVKEKLRLSMFGSSHNKLTIKDQNILQERKRRKLKKLQKTAYNKSQAEHIIRKKHLNSSEESKLKIGPTTNQDLRFLSQTKDKRLLYSILGTNGEQLRDSKLIYEDVQKFIKRGQMEKAVFLTKLAKGKGSAGMNLIIDHYLRNLHMPTSAVKLYNWRKKNGVPLNEYSNTILFDGIAKQPEQVSTKIGEFVTHVVESLIQEEKLSLIEFNSALGALSNCKDVRFCFDIYKMVKESKYCRKSIRKDAITYTWLLRASSKLETFRLFGETFNDIMDSLTRNIIDSRLLFEICKTVAEKDGTYGLYALQKYFEIQDSNVYNGNDSLSIYDLSHWDIANKYRSNNHVLGLQMDLYISTGKLREGIRCYKRTFKESAHLIDLDIFQKYLKMIILYHPSSCVQECLNALKEAESVGKRFNSKHTKILLYESYMRQSAKKMINADAKNVQALLAQLENFIKDTEGEYSSEFKQKLFPRNAWKFYYRILDNCNANNQVPNEIYETTLVNFLKCLCANVFTIKDVKLSEYKSNKYIELECVRLINRLMADKDLSEFNITTTKEDKKKREQFLERRLLQKLKNKLLNHIEFFESNKTKDGSSIEEVELSLNQLSHQLLAEYYS